MRRADALAAVSLADPLLGNRKLLSRYESGKRLWPTGTRGKGVVANLVTVARERALMRKLFRFSRFWIGQGQYWLFRCICLRRSSPALELANGDLQVGANRSVRPAHKEPPT